MATPGMETLVSTVRRLTMAGTAEYTAAGTAWWSDDQIEQVLNFHCRDIVGEQLTPEKTMTGGGSVEWRTYRSRYRNLGGAITIEDSLGDERGTAEYTVDRTHGVVTFTADQGGTALYLTGRAYDPHGAAAEVLEAWAAAVSLDFGFGTDGQRFDRQQKAEMLAKRAGEQRRRAWAKGLKL